MAQFVVELRYRVQREERQPVNPAHRDYLLGLADRNVLVMAAPLLDENGALAVYEVADREELQQVLDAEPYEKAGFIAETQVRPLRTIFVTGVTPPPTGSKD